MMDQIDYNNPPAKVLQTWLDIWSVTLVGGDLIYAIFCVSRHVFISLTASKVRLYIPAISLLCKLEI
jgi:hypothetical protein